MNETPLLRSNVTNSEPEFSDVSNLLGADVIINTLTVILTTTVNMCLIAIEIKVWRKRKRISQPKMLILFSAANDILSSLLGVLPRLFIYTQIDDCFSAVNVFVYKFVRFCLKLFFFLSKLMVVLMGIERCISIRTPFFYIRKCTLKAFCITEAALVIYALIFAIISVYFEYIVFEKVMTPERFAHMGCHRLFLTFEYGVLNNPLTYRAEIPFQTDGFTILQIVQEVILVTSLIICNAAVMCGLRDMQRKVHLTRSMSCEQYNKEPDVMASTGKEFSRLMLAVIVVFIILITPSAARKLCNQIGVVPSYLADFICHHIALASTFTNPFLYGLLRRKIRYKFAIRVTSCCRGCLPETMMPMVTSSQISDSRQFTFGRGLQQTTVVASHVAASCSLNH